MTDEAENRLLLTADFWKFAQKAFPRVMTDVVYWINTNKSPRIAFVGNPLKVANIFGLLDPEAEAAPGLGWLLGRAVKQTLDPNMSAGDMQDWERSGMSMGELFERLTSQTIWSWVDLHGSVGDEGARVGFIPDPGFPWPCKDGKYWSAREQKWKKSERPAWIVEIEDPFDRPKMIYGVNPCAVFPSDETKTTHGGPVYGVLDNMPMMVTHCMDLSEPNQVQATVKSHRHLDTAIEGIKDCGGLLLPSLAVGPIPATNFGPIVLVSHLELVTDSLLPYRKGSRRRPCWVYGSDAWTETTGGMLGRMAAELFDELHGNDHWQGRYIATLGVPSCVSGMGGEHQPLKNTKQLASALRTRMRLWSRDISHEQFVEMDKDATPLTKYAYAEAKSREVTRLDEFPYLIAPKSMKKIVDRFVRGVGYKGEVIFLDAGVIGRNEWYVNREREFNLYQWGWLVADKVKTLRPVVKVLT